MDRSAGGWKNTGARPERGKCKLNATRTKEKEEDDDNLIQIEECPRNEELVDRTEDHKHKSRQGRCN